MKPRVCLVGPVYPYRGGIAHYTSLLAQEFANDHEVFVVNFTRQYPSLLFPGKTQYDESGEPLDIASKRVIDSINPFTYKQAADEIIRFAPDFVVFQWWHPFFAPAYRTIAWLVRRRSDARIIFLCHNVLPHENSIVDRTLIKAGLGGAHRFLVQSREDERNLLKFDAQASVKVHPHPIYDFFNKGRYTRESARQELSIDGNVLLFFGYIRAYKGLDLLLEGYAESVRHTKSHLFIVGEFYEDKQPYLDRIDKLGIADSITLVDRYVPNEEVEKYFAACDALVLPYRSATQSGIVQIAYGFDRPVIVTAVGGLPDVVEDGVTGLVVPPNDPAALADAIGRMFRDGESERLRANIDGVKARFSWAGCKAALEQLAADRRH